MALQHYRISFLLLLLLLASCQINTESVSVDNFVASIPDYPETISRTGQKVDLTLHYPGEGLLPALEARDFSYLAAEFSPELGRLGNVYQLPPDGEIEDCSSYPEKFMQRWSYFSSLAEERGDSVEDIKKNKERMIEESRYEQMMCYWQGAIQKGALDACEKFPQWEPGVSRGSSSGIPTRYFLESPRNECLFHIKLNQYVLANGCSSFGPSQYGYGVFSEYCWRQQAIYNRGDPLDVTRPPNFYSSYPSYHERIFPETVITREGKPGYLNVGIQNNKKRTSIFDLQSISCSSFLPDEEFTLSLQESQLEILPQGSAGLKLTIGCLDERCTTTLSEGEYSCKISLEEQEGERLLLRTYVIVNPSTPSQLTWDDVLG